MYTWAEIKEIYKHAVLNLVQSVYHVLVSSGFFFSGTVFSFTKMQTSFFPTGNFAYVILKK